jgi:polysaccharide biosynthesis protein PslH
VASAPLLAGTAADHDLLFLGKLSYPPNVEAIRNLARAWPQLQRRRPGTTLLLAGASPSAAVLETAKASGWDVLADFDELADVVPRVRLAVAPLDHASGIQGKVLSSAAFGLGQVLSPVAAAGLEPGFPCRLADTDVALIDAIAELLDDDDELRRLGAEARTAVAETYRPGRWAGWASDILQGRTGDGVA